MVAHDGCASGCRRLVHHFSRPLEARQYELCNLRSVNARLCNSRLVNLRLVSSKLCNSESSTIDAGAQNVAAAPGKLSQLTSLTLDLNENSIGDDGA